MTGRGAVFYVARMDTIRSPPAPGREGNGLLRRLRDRAALLLGLLAWGAWALDEFEKGLDGAGQLEQSGALGDRRDPLGPGATARYEDGLKVTVGPPRREPDARTA
ncbi:hypothetical protein GCM10023238_15230 [Streptomyces heliomycini]